MEKRIDSINRLAQHQVMLLEKDSFTKLRPKSNSAFESFIEKVKIPQHEIMKTDIAFTEDSVG